MGEFVVSSEREGNAKAIIEQRRNMNVTTSVASDVYGDVAEGNVGEFLKFLPGVDLEYVDAETRGPRLGGLDPQYAGVTLDGSKLASADAFASYNGMINGGTGDAVRSVGFEQMSINSIESIEISRTSSADMDADAPAGTINLKTKRAFDRKGRQPQRQFRRLQPGKNLPPGRHQDPRDPPQLHLRLLRRVHGATARGPSRHQPVEGAPAAAVCHPHLQPHADRGRSAADGADGRRVQ
jgi:hypothetical protein